MATNIFEQNLKRLDFSFIKKKGESGVMLTSGYETLNQSKTSPDILFALETAKERFGADAVYFRYFTDGRAAVPQIYIFDYTVKKLTDEDKRRIHIQMWSGYQVPIYILIEKSSVSVFDARKKPETERENHASEIITLIGTAVKAFSAKSFNDGLFWEEQDDKRFRFEESAARDLIAGLKKVYNQFQKDSGLNQHVALKLLVQSLLIKYLEERDEDSKSGYFAGRYFKTHFNAENFCDVIRQGKLLNLLDQLSSDFNGKIFKWDKQNESEARKAIRQASVKHLADYLDAKIQNNQYVLWRLYSFSHLPVEVISSVYEELLTNSKDIVYTPEMIVSTLVDECMPLKQPRQDFKLIDVSCGSGIFLVKAYKRIIQWWRYEEWLKTGELKKPSLATLNKLLLKSIHGIDIQTDAIRLSVFSLALALLDEVDLNPPTWQKLRFPDLSENISTGNFFRFISTNPSSSFDLIIGNPPFNLTEVDGKEPDRKKYFKALKEEVGYNCEISIPDENPALHFLVQSMKLLKEEGLLCLIQPSGPLLYEQDTTFKQALFTKYNLLQVIDFTKLSDILWGRKTVATAAVFLQKCLPDKEDVVHIVANRTFSNRNRLFLEFDHYDFHVISKAMVLNNPYVWKANLLGGGKLTGLIERLATLPTLKEYLDQKESECNWKYGDGFIKGKPDDQLKPSDFEKKKGGYSKAPFLTGSICFDPEDFDEKGVKRTYIIQDKYFQWPRVPELFKGPVLVIKKNIGRKSIPTYFFETDISFKNEVIGIHAPKEDRPLLRKLESAIKDNELYRFYLTLTSSRSGISRSLSTLLQKDILNIPYSEETSNVKLAAAEKILVRDVLEYQIEKGEKVLSTHCLAEDVNNFADIFCKTLNSVYQKEGKKFRPYKVLDAGRYYALHIEYTIKEYDTLFEVTESLEQYLQEVIPTKQDDRSKVAIQKIMKIYGKDCIVLSKPKQLRYWLGSIALRDADSTFADYINARYYAQG